MNKYLIIILVLNLLCCEKKEQFEPISTRIINPVDINKNTKNFNWLYKDIINDSIPGISLYRAKNEILKNKKPERIVVAVIDSKFDINHLELKNFLWKNENETLNKIDDDNNGFVDDIHGWNFLGNAEGENITNANYEYVRLLRYYEGVFKNKSKTEVNKDDSTLFDNYIKAKEKLDSELISTGKKLEYSNNLIKRYFDARAALRSYFPELNYTLETLNTIDTVRYKNLAPHVKEIGEVIKWKENDDMIVSVNKFYDDKLNKLLNINFNERELVGDNPYDLNDTIYGNNNVSSLVKEFDHGTRVSSVITGLSKNDNNQIKILALSTSPNGNYHDKDLALGIKYAVDNGAKVINMSFAKSYSIHNEWVLEAIKYAEQNDVIIVKAAGNSDSDLLISDDGYPRDYDTNGLEISDNFLVVGASSPTANENLRADFSNYGKNLVDVFAPGKDLQTAIPFNKYREDSGTSLSAALTSGVAALIFSYYPNLTASQVKHIIMDSGVEYTFPVKTPTKEDKEKMTPFNELSKSGKIVNAFNALIMADSVSKANKRKRD
jgi:subtilisin family serine protease